MNINLLHEKYNNKELKVVDHIRECFEAIEKNDNNSFISLNKEEALEKAAILDKKLEEGHVASGLFGVGLALKDNVLTKDLRTTGASKALDNYIPVYDATIVEKIKESDLIILGKTNMDELAMGGSSETSYYGHVNNPVVEGRIPGGSSSGSAVAVAAGEALISIGTDTGGSCRNPANYCNVIGFAPSYGAISRYGVISMSNSLDRVGIMGNKVEEVSDLFNLISGRDDHDYTSLDLEKRDGVEEVDLTKTKIAYVKLKDEYEVDKDFKDHYEKAIELLKDKGARIEEVSLDNLEYINGVYTIIMSVEAASNVARLDGIRYGETVLAYDDTNDLYMKNRTENFGEEVKRRIALGTYFASKEDNQKYYRQAMKLRNLLKKQMDEVLDGFDFVLSPTNTEKPHEVGAVNLDANAAFDSGMFNVLTNLVNLPAISLPMDKEEIGSVQFIGRRNKDQDLLDLAYTFERILG